MTRASHCRVLERRAKRQRRRLVRDADRVGEGSSVVFEGKTYAHAPTRRTRWRSVLIRRSLTYAAVFILGGILLSFLGVKCQAVVPPHVVVSGLCEF